MPYLIWINDTHIIIYVGFFYTVSDHRAVIHLFVSDRACWLRSSAARFLSILRTDLAISPAALSAMVLTISGSIIPVFDISIVSPVLMSMPKPGGDAFAAITFSRPLNPALVNICRMML